MEPKGSNIDLQKLAAEAKAEDQEREGDKFNESTGEVETKADQAAAAEAAAQKMAKGMVSGMSMAVRSFYGVEYGDKLKAEAVEKLAPCLSAVGEPPAWVTSMLGQYGQYIEAGVFFGSVGISTYNQVQEAKRQEEKSSVSNSEPTKPEAGPSEPASAVHGVDR